MPALRHTAAVRCAVPGMRRWQRRRLRRTVRRALEILGAPVPCRVDILVTDDPGIRALNRRLRGIDRATDVLSFPALTLTPGQMPARRHTDPDTGRAALGDMALSLPRTVRQAREYGHGLGRELSYLAVHSLLHLLGYDHTDEGREKRRMRRREEAILRALGQGRRRDYIQMR